MINYKNTRYLSDDFIKVKIEYRTTGGYEVYLTDIKTLNEVFVNPYGADYSLDFLRQQNEYFFEDELFIDIDNSFCKDDVDSRLKRSNCSRRKSECEVSLAFLDKFWVFRRIMNKSPIKT